MHGKMASRCARATGATEELNPTAGLACEVQDLGEGPGVRFRGLGV